MASAFLNASDDEKCRYAEIVLLNLWIKDDLVQDFLLKSPYESITRLPKNPTMAQPRRGREVERRSFHSLPENPRFSALSYTGGSSCPSRPHPSFESTLSPSAKQKSSYLSGH